MWWVTGATLDATSTASGRAGKPTGFDLGTAAPLRGERVVEGHEVEQPAFGGDGQAGPVPATGDGLDVGRVPPRLRVPAVAVERDAPGADARSCAASSGTRADRPRPRRAAARPAGCIRSRGRAPRPRAGDLRSSDRRAGSRARRSRASSSASSAFACPRRRYRLSVQMRLSSAVVVVEAPECAAGDGPAVEQADQQAAAGAANSSAGYPRSHFDTASLGAAIAVGVLDRQLRQQRLGQSDHPGRPPRSAAGSRLARTSLKCLTPATRTHSITGYSAHVEQETPGR